MPVEPQFRSFGSDLQCLPRQASAAFARTALACVTLICAKLAATALTTAPARAEPVATPPPAEAEAEPFNLPPISATQRPPAALIPALVNRLIALPKGETGPSAALAQVALKAFESGNLVHAEAWYQLAAWAQILEQPQKDYARTWQELTQPKGVNDSQSTRSPLLKNLGSGSLAQLFTAAQLQALLGDPALSAGLLERLTPRDYLPEVLKILQELKTHDARNFATHLPLAIAIAVVYDQTPPQGWPHYQVNLEVLPRRLPEPTQAFDFLVKADATGQTLHKLRALTAEELRFTVDLAASERQLLWAQTNVRIPLTNLDHAYTSVRYDMRRIELGAYDWPHPSYSLMQILSLGGICVDQAYFATQVSKAKGVPTLLFFGEGADSRHAWFGYLGPQQRWRLDAGRGSESKFITGYAYDPQTWTLFTDHELTYLTADFRRLPPYRQSSQLERFASLYLDLGQTEKAGAVARKAVNLERRNLKAWTTLLAAQTELPAKTREATHREAALAFVLYPDLNAFFTQNVISCLRERGETSAANYLLSNLARKNQSSRSDLTVSIAAELMQEAMRLRSPVARMERYRQILQVYGSGGGIAFFDQVVLPFVRHLAKEKDSAGLRQTLLLASKVLNPPAGSQLDNEFQRLTASLP